MRKIRNVFLFVTLLTCGLLYGQDGYTDLPYFCGFEESEDTIGTYSWKFEKPVKVKHTFTVGNAVHRMGEKALYVSADNGVTAGYTNSGGSVVIAYKSFYLAKGTYDLVFDYRLQGEDYGNSDVMRVAFVPGTKPTTVSLNQFPKYALNYPFVSNAGDSIFKTTLWTQVEGQVEAQDSGYYYLVFLFKENGNKSVYAPGACIDNIQLDRAKSPTACAVKPTNILIDKDGSGIKLSWTGRADSYELIYYRMRTLADTTYTMVKGIVGNEYFIPYSLIPEGVYNFRLRALCSTDTSFWVEKSNYIVYDDTRHCLNYMDFSLPGTTCAYGSFANPSANVRVVDYGYESRHSIHTVHYMEDEYDRLTGYKLKTVPEGSVASVRLGNWTEGPHGDSPVKEAVYPGGSPSGQITYTYTIPEDKSVLLLHYAAVLQFAAHHAPENQTRIQVQIKNRRGELLECASADFNAKDVSEGNTRGWNTYQPQEGETLISDCPIKWLDWSVLGINLKDYKGQTVNIILTLNACEADYHFAYGYFALDCTAGEVGGMSCTEKADTLFVPEGFDYLWYVQGDDKKEPVSTERFFVPQENDINSYAVDLIYPEKDGCYFTLYANVWPRVPKVDVAYEHKPQNCVNYIQMINNSRMVDLKMDESGKVVDTLEVDGDNALIKDYYWEIKSNKGSMFENGQIVSAEKNPRIVVPNEGDTFTIVLRGVYNSCEDIREYTIKAPDASVSFGETYMYICDGGEVEFNGAVYKEPGVYIDTLKSVFGCDSILQLTLRTLIADTVRIDTTICSSDVPYLWLGELCDSTGVYEKGRPSSLGCDSIYYILDLTVIETLDIELSEMPLEICSDDDLFEIEYDVLSGRLSGYKVSYSEKAKEVGFLDEEIIFEEDSAKVIVIDLPEGVQPNRYAVDLVFYNSDCGNVDTTLTFDVLYSKEVISQRWNDVLAIKNEEYNGGYEFLAYQWYLNGEILEGLIGSQLYENGKDLDFNGKYQVLLTRKEDGVAMLTCGFTPYQFTESEMEDAGVVIFTKGDEMNVEVAKSAQAWMYDLSGMLYSIFDLSEGKNILNTEIQSGLYIMQIYYLDGEMESKKVVINN